VVLGHRRAEAASDGAGADAPRAGEALLLADRTAAGKRIVVNVCLIPLMRLPPSHIIRSGLALCDRSRTAAVNPWRPARPAPRRACSSSCAERPTHLRLDEISSCPIRDPNVLSPPFLADNAAVDGSTRRQHSPDRQRRVVRPVQEVRSWRTTVLSCSGAALIGTLLVAGWMGR
jgi:hypothetical protein